MSIKQLKWKEFPMGRRQPCDIYWHGVSFHESDNLSSGQVNKFPGMAEMVHKISLSRAVRTMQELYPEEYNFYPQSWILPEEYHLFVAQLLPGVYEHVQSLVDEEVKIPIIRDTLRLVDPARTRINCNQSNPSESTLETNKVLYIESTEQVDPEMNKLPESSIPSNCFKQVFPKYSKQFNYLRVVERVASIFLQFLGIKGTMKLGPTGFRTFIRHVLAGLCGSLPLLGPETIQMPSSSRTSPVFDIIV